MMHNPYDPLPLYPVGWAKAVRVARIVITITTIAAIAGVTFALKGMF